MVGNQGRRENVPGKIRIAKILSYLLLILFFGSSIVYGAVSPGNEPVEVTSERLEADYTAGKIRFLGKVIAKQGQVTIYSEELVLLMNQGDRQVRQIEAFRNVRIEKGARIATGQTAIYDRTSEKIVLTGSPRVQQGEDFVEGDEITFFINEDRSTVKSKAGSRVNAVFHPKEKADAP